MKKASFVTSACRYCRYYQPEGRRGGDCQKLGVPVQSNWDACLFGSSPFETAWDNLEEILLLENSLSLNCSAESPINKSFQPQQITAANEVNQSWRSTPGTVPQKTPTDFVTKA